MPTVPTVKVEDGDGDYVVVNEADFDEDEHTLFEEDEAPEDSEPDLFGEDVAFASSAAEELATDEGLTADDFEGVEASGATGFTKADVETVLSHSEEE